MSEPVRVALPPKPEPEKTKADEEHKQDPDRCPHCGRRQYTGPGSGFEVR